MRNRRIHWNVAIQPPLAERYASPRVPSIRKIKQSLQNWVDSLTIFPRHATFISKVQQIADETHAAQRSEKRRAKQTILNRIDTHLKEIANGLEAAIEREAKETGNGALYFKILQPNNLAQESNVSSQLPNNGHALIIEADIRKTPGFAQLAAKCVAIGVKLQLVEHWANIDWDLYSGGNAALVWQITISGW
jgi:hypothetical protein